MEPRLSWGHRNLEMIHDLRDLSVRTQSPMKIQYEDNSAMSSLLPAKGSDSRMLLLAKRHEALVLKDHQKFNPIHILSYSGYTEYPCLFYKAGQNML